MEGKRTSISSKSAATFSSIASLTRFHTVHKCSGASAVAFFIRFFIRLIHRLRSKLIVINYLITRFSQLECVLSRGA